MSTNSVRACGRVAVAAPPGVTSEAETAGRTRSPRVHGWIDVEQVPFKGPKLSPRRRDGTVGTRQLRGEQ